MNQMTDDVQTFSADMVQAAQAWTPWFQQWFREPPPREAMRAAHAAIASGAWVEKARKLAHND